MSTMTTESGMRTQSRIAVSSTSSSAIGTVRGGLATSYLGGAATGDAALASRREETRGGEGGRRRRGWMGRGGGSEEALALVDGG
jgi:hypothetical protein